jgi:hypothetical protein
MRLDGLLLFTEAMSNLKKCSRCDKRSTSNTFLYNGRVFGPTCYAILMESVNWRARLPMVRENSCSQCKGRFFAPTSISCIDTCCACCSSQNPGYEAHPCVKDTRDGAGYQNPKTTANV